LHRFEQLLEAVENVARSSYSGWVYRLISYEYRDSLLAVTGAVKIGGRYNPPKEFGVLYTCDTQLTANLEVEALFVDKNGRLAGAPRNPDLILTLACEMRRVIDLRQRRRLRLRTTLLWNRLLLSRPERAAGHRQGECRSSFLP
jgi:RES domain